MTFENDATDDLETITQETEEADTDYVVLTNDDFIPATQVRINPRPGSFDYSDDMPMDEFIRARAQGLNPRTR